MILKSPLFFHALKFTITQGFLSAAAAVLIGFIAAPGYARLGPLKKYLRWILLIPNLMSPILVVLALLLSLEKFPFGMGGIILGHIFLNGGLATVWLGESWESIEAQWAPVYVVSGGSFFHFVRKILAPLMIPSVLSAFAVIFSFCISSFAIPLIFGGGPQNSTLEVLIYEKLKTDADFYSALLIALAQCLLQIALFIVVLKATAQIQVTESKRFVPFSKLSLFLIPTFLVALISILPFFKIGEIALSQYAELPRLISSDAYKEATVNSFLIALGVSASTFICLCFFLKNGPKIGLSRLPALSGVVVGLGALFILSHLGLTNQSSFIIILIFGHMSVILLPVLRLCFPTLYSVSHQYGPPATQMGAKKFFTFKKVFLPLSTKALILGSLLAFVWSLGEFSVTRIAAGEFQTLPLIIESLLSSYRLELASLASLVLLCVTLVILFLIEGVTDGVG